MSRGYSSPLIKPFQPTVVRGLVKISPEACVGTWEQTHFSKYTRMTIMRSSDASLAYSINRFAYTSACSGSCTEQGLTRQRHGHVNSSVVCTYPTTTRILSSSPLMTASTCLRPSKTVCAPRSERGILCRSVRASCTIRAAARHVLLDQDLRAAFVSIEIRCSSGPEAYGMRGRIVLTRRSSSIVTAC